MTKPFASVIGVIGATLLSVFMVVPQTAFAAPGTTITTAPSNINQIIKPGTSYSTILQVLNSGSQPVPLTIQVQSLSAHGDQGDAAIVPFASNDPAPSYVHFSATKLVAQPGAWTKVDMTINMPVSAQLGYYYAVIFKPVNNTNSAQSGATFIGSNAILALIDTQSSNEKRQLNLISFTATQKRYDYLPATFNIDIHNSGNIYLPPRGDIFISKSSEPGSKNIATIPVNLGAGSVLPNSNRVFSVMWQDGFPSYMPEKINGKIVYDASGQPVEQLKWDFSQLHNFRFGKYYAHLILAYNNGYSDIPIESTVSFWVIPWELITLAIIVILVLLLGLALIGWFLLRTSRRLVKPAPKRRR
jgi:hypothetical protein